MPTDLWDEVVGIPLDDWLRATTVTELEWLRWLRENPRPRVRCMDESHGDCIYADTGQLLRVICARGCG